MPDGKLYLVGLGPGSRGLMAEAAIEVLCWCDAVVGYRGYIEQVQDLLDGKEVVALGLGEEMERAARAVEMASAGRTVALVSSGDVGIYGMAAPVFQHLSANDWDGERPEVEVVPGVSAMQAAASLLGAPLMQDFCAISLSDLLTPWDAIRRRLEMAAQGDFVVVLYNPRSQRRTRHVVEAREVLMACRSEFTPVGIVRNAYRPDQSVLLTTLGDMDSHFEDIDMFSTVVVGNSTTYVHQGRMVTPRGYESKNASTE